MNKIEDAITEVIESIAIVDSLHRKLNTTLIMLKEEQNYIDNAFYKKQYNELTKENR